MSSEYSGTPGNYPTTVTLSSDGDLRNAQSVNNGLSDLADRTEYLRAGGGGVRAVQYWEGPIVPPDSTGRAIAYGGATHPIHVVVGASDKISVSRNLRTWVARTPTGGSGLTLETVASNNGDTFVTGGTGGTFLFRSTDAGNFTWAATAALPGSPVSVSHIIWHSGSGGLFVLLGANGSGYIATSSDGATWTQRTSAISNTLARVASSGSLLVCLVSGTSTVYQTSPDGITWTSRTAPGGSKFYSDVYYNPETTLWVLVSTNGDVWTSTDAISWTLRTTGSLLYSPKRVVSRGGLIAIGLNHAFTEGGVAVLFTDDLGATWQEVIVAATFNLLKDMIVAQDRFVLCGISELFFTPGFRPAKTITL